MFPRLAAFWSGRGYDVVPAITDAGIDAAADAYAEWMRAVAVVRSAGVDLDDL
jgi:hypothetical protein